MSFNPRLTSAARRTDWSVAKGRTCLVSIRASLQQRGELRDHFAAKFYSCVSIRASLQQRGELIESLPSVLIEVSIRASLQQRGEPVGPAALISPVAFQSAPHFRSEANARRSGARAPT